MLAPPSGQRAARKRGNPPLLFDLNPRKDGGAGRETTQRSGGGLCYHSSALQWDKIQRVISFWRSKHGASTAPRAEQSGSCVRSCVGFALYAHGDSADKALRAGRGGAGLLATWPFGDAHSTRGRERDGGECRPSPPCFTTDGNKLPSRPSMKGSVLACRPTQTNNTQCSAMLREPALSPVGTPPA